MTSIISIMNTQEQPKEPRDEPHALDRNISGDEIGEVKAILRENVKPIVAVACILIAGFAVLVVRHVRASAGIRSSEMLSSARSVQDLEMVIARHPSTLAAPLALLRLAKAHFDSGNYEVALNKYDEFKLKFPEHQMADAADLGKIHCMEARGQLAEALTAFTTFVRGHPDHFLRPQALFGQARCLQQLGRLREARTLYEDFIAKNPGSVWLSRAEESLRTVTRKLARNLTSVPDAGPRPTNRDQQETTFEWGPLSK